MISLINITQEAFTLYHDQIMAIEEVSFPSPWKARAFLEETRNPVSHFWALKEGEQILGYICFWMYAGEVHLLNIAVHPERRRQGLGMVLVEKMKQFALSQNAQRIYLEVRPSNLAARRLYLRTRFEEKGRRKRYYTDTGEDAIIMAFECCREVHSGLDEATSTKGLSPVSEPRDGLEHFRTKVHLQFQ